MQLANQLGLIVRINNPTHPPHTLTPHPHPTHPHPTPTQTLPPAAAKGDPAALNAVIAQADRDAAAAAAAAEDDDVDRRMNPRAAAVVAVRLCESAERIKVGTNRGQLVRALEKDQVGGGWVGLGFCGVVWGWGCVVLGVVFGWGCVVLGVV